MAATEIIFGFPGGNMLDSIEKLLGHRKAYFSASGEDGLLEFVLQRIPDSTKWCVEFGAWDGQYLSNTFFFISRLGYKAVLIEANADKFAALKYNMKLYDVVCLNKYVSYEGPDSLDKILRETPVPTNFDLLSIDVDGDDYQIWECLSHYRPKVVIIEIGVFYAPGVIRVNRPGSPYVYGVTGTSISSMTELAEIKGYKLLACVGYNAVFVKREYFCLFHDRDVTPEEVFTYPLVSIIRNVTILRILTYIWPIIPGRAYIKRVLNRFIMITRRFR